MPRPLSHLEAVSRTPLPCRIGHLRLDVNENPDGLPRQFVEKVLARVDPGGLSAYPEYEALEERLATLHGVSPDRVVLGNGSDGIIRDLFAAYVGLGDGVLLADPSFAMYPIYAQLHDARLATVSYLEDRSFPVTSFLERIGPDLKLAIVVNPNNPTGTDVPQAALEAIIERCAASDVLLIVDEAYVQFLGRSIIHRAGTADHLVVLRTFSKLCGIAALRLGYAVCAPTIARNVRRVRPTYDVNGLAVLFGHAILDEPGLMSSLLESLQEGRQWLVSRLAESGIDHFDTLGNFVMIRCGSRVQEIVQKLAATGILVKGGFGEPYLREHVRVSLGSRATMERFWTAFLAIWNR